MLSWLVHGSGIIIMTACGNERPASTSNSRQLSNIAESLPSVFMIGKSICAEPGVDQRQSAFHRVIVEFGIKQLQLLRHQHAFIDDGLVGKAGDIKRLAAFDSTVANGIFRALTDDVKLALKRHVIPQL